MMPNTEKFTTDGNKILFKCECGGHHFLEVTWDPDLQDFWFIFCDYPTTLWEAIKWYWKNKKMWTSEIELNEGDVRNLNFALSNFLQSKSKASIK